MAFKENVLPLIFFASLPKKDSPLPIKDSANSARICYAVSSSTPKITLIPEKSGRVVLAREEGLVLGLQARQRQQEVVAKPLDRKEYK